MKIQYMYDGHGFMVYPVKKQRIGDDNSRYIQTDYDYPGLARLFGWNSATRRGCKHQGTDGTVDCPDCDMKAYMFIHKAFEYLLDNEGKIINDDSGSCEGDDA